ncbi:MAG: hypothetical protein E7F09_05525 [Clostridium perfringens]|nr:hypothetical protein [Clostridium perfringens]
MGCRASYGGMERKCRVTGDRCVFMIPDENYVMSFLEKDHWNMRKKRI